MNPQNSQPFYMRLTNVLLSLTLIIALFYVGHQIIFPVLLALLFAILLRPVVALLNRKLRFPHVIAAAVTVIIAVLLLSGVVLFISWQIGDITNDWDKIQRNLSIHLHHIQQWIKQSFDISYTDQDKYLKQATKNSLGQGSSMVGNTLSSFTDALLNLVVIPFYTFLFLLYRVHLILFLSKLFKDEYQEKLQDILRQVKVVIQSFLLGLLTEMLIVATLTSFGYMIVGVQYALLLGVITGILNLIPYVGITIAGLLSIFATLTGSPDLSLVFGVLMVNVIVQFLDNNILVPLIVSSKVKINALVSIIGIIAGGAIGGVAGMFMAIPLIAILKVIFDRIEFLEPWGYLMGDDLPKTSDWGKIKLPSFNAGSSTKEIKKEEQRKIDKKEHPNGEEESKKTK